MEKKTEKITFIMTHWAQDSFRSDTLRRSLESVIATTLKLPVEIIVIDNGANLSDSMYLLTLCHQKKIQYYIRNSENMYFGFARNQGLQMASGDYIVISDNDIYYYYGWLEKCLSILKALPEEKIGVTPLKADRIHRVKHWTRWFEVNGEKFPGNMRAGSNSWVMRRKDFIEVGGFKNHRIAGSKWADDFVNKGYTMVTMETKPLAKDIGFQRGYNFKKPVDIVRKYTNKEEVKIND